MPQQNGFSNMNKSSKSFASKETQSQVRGREIFSSNVTADPRDFEQDNPYNEPSYSQPQQSQPQQPQNNNNHKSNNRNGFGKHSNSVPRWKQHLYDRGYTDAQIEYYGWKPAKIVWKDPLPGEDRKDYEFVECSDREAQGWVYPIYYPESKLTSRRFKSFPDSDFGFKVLSDKKVRMPGGEHPPFYVPSAQALEDMKQAIRASGGTLYMVEGEPNVLAMSVMGMVNVTSIWGSESLKPTLQKYLDWMGVKKIVYIADADDSGAGAAQKLWNELYYTTIDVVCYQVPPEFEGISRANMDINDILKDIKYDNSKFLKVLRETLPQNLLSFPPPERKKSEASYKNREYRGKYDMDAMLNDLIDEHEHRYGRIEANSENWTRNVPCPHVQHAEDDKKYAFGINILTGAGHCFKCKKTGQGDYSLIDNAKAYGLDVEQYRIADSRPPAIDRSYQQNFQQPEDLLLSEAEGYYELAKSQPSQVNYDMVDASEYIAKRSDVMRKAKRRAVGEEQEFNTFSVRWPIDDPQLVACGGYLKNLVAGKMVEIIAASGGGKTTAYKAIENAMNQDGINTLSWSPEFDEVEHGDTVLQTLTGINSIRMLENDQYWIEAIKDSNTAKFGEIFDEAERVEVLRAADEIMAWPGEAYQVTRFGKDIFDVLKMFDRACDIALAEGREIQVVFLDYAQLMQNPVGFPGWDANQTVIQFKSWCNHHGEYVNPVDGKTYIRRKKVGVVTSQATKASTKAVRMSQQDYLRAEDAMVLRPDWFNLILAVKWGEKYGIGEFGPCREYQMYVLKNSKGAAYDEASGSGVASLMFELKRMRIRWLSVQRLTENGRIVNNNVSSFDTMVTVKTFERKESTPKRGDEDDE